MDIPDHLVSQVRDDSGSVGRRHDLSASRARSMIQEMRAVIHKLPYPTR